MVDYNLWAEQTKMFLRIRNKGRELTDYEKHLTDVHIIVMRRIISSKGRFGLLRFSKNVFSKDMQKQIDVGVAEYLKNEAMGIEND